MVRHPVARIVLAAGNNGSGTLVSASTLPFGRVAWTSEKGRIGYNALSLAPPATRQNLCRGRIGTLKPGLHTRRSIKIFLANRGIYTYRLREPTPNRSP